MMVTTATLPRRWLTSVTLVCASISPGNTVLDIALVQICLLGHCIGGQVLDVLGRALVAEHFLDALDHLILHTHRRHDYF